MTTDEAFKEILQNIPERDQAVLERQHGITNFSQLMDKKPQLQQRQLEDVCSDVQMGLEVVCTFLETLDETSSFTWEGFENFCEYNDKTGDYDLPEETKSKNADVQENADPLGYNLTAEERKQMEDQLENDPLTMKIRGFSARALLWEADEKNKKLTEGTSEKTEVAFNGSVYYVNKCYYFQQENGSNVVVGIRKFTKVSSFVEDLMIDLIQPFSFSTFARFHSSHRMRRRP